MPPRAVVFDLDGLMFNTEQIYPQVLRELLRRRKLEYTQELTDRMMGRPGHAAFEVMIGYHDLTESPSELQAESDIIFLALLTEQLAPMPGLAELLTTLERHTVPKAIATSSRRSYVERILGQFDFLPRFQFLLTAEDVSDGKPHPEIYFRAAARLGIAPAEMIVLEDSHNGCRAAVAAGAIAIAVPGDHSRLHDFTGARLIADSLRDARIYEMLGLSTND